MKRNKFPIYTGVLIALAVAATVVHGRLTNRWGNSTAQLRAAPEALQLAPHEFGNWRLKSETDLSDLAKRILRCTGPWDRTYEHRTSGKRVSMAMMVGPPDVIAVHEVEVCYAHRGYTQSGQGSRFKLTSAGSTQHEFIERNLISPDVSARKVQMFYSFRQTDRWCTPDYARFAFVSYPLIFKIQLSAFRSDDVLGKRDDPCREFLRDYLPVLEETVFTNARLDGS